METNKLVIIGGTGHIGKQVIKNYSENYSEILSIGLEKTNYFENLENVNHIKSDISDIDDTSLLRLFNNKKQLLIALGKDTRYTPRKPAIDYYRKHNVKTINNLLRIARLAKIRKVIIVGSIYTYFNDKYPELQLEKHHPYITSMVEQKEVAFRYKSSTMSIIFVDIPYLIGDIEHKTPLYSVVDEFLSTRNHLYYPMGGTSIATIDDAARTIIKAFDSGISGSSYPVFSYNLEWKNFFNKVLLLKGQEHKKLIKYSDKKTIKAMKLKQKRFSNMGLEPGINPVKYLKFEKLNTFINSNDCLIQPADSKKELEQLIDITLKNFNKLHMI